MTPTDDMLDAVAAKVCGWIDDGFPRTIAPDGRKTFGYPQYHEDRNALAEIWRVVEAANKRGALVAYLTAPDFAQKLELPVVLWNCHIAAPRRVVIAALKALGAWPAEWDDATE